ncbi:flavonoid 3'-monooxygenase-like [Selaginella moellendorffii]|uniref:flavonoid 3'-monooxygenase-like n=1 Tax=Selaginella moellendorffii TaxID=88036 RepID=UPI000D1CC3E5|nr:flavonoid 3'-monooxygenase-like [Selaginella moellendorffii]|eukprot:XP_024521429.1 flavonoid 3'-monooxygenase-like [Selaginella moellendorffii]
MPHHSLQKLSRKFGKIMYLKLGMIPAIVISSPDLAKQMFKTEDTTFSFRPYLLVGEHSGYNFKGIALANGDHWKSTRKICTTELFTVKRIDSFLWVRMEELSYLVSSLAQACNDQSIVDVREHLTVLTFNVQTRILMSKRFFGENLSDDELAEARVFKELIDESVKFAFQFHISEFVPSWLKWIDWNIPQAKRVAAKQDEFLQKIIDEHKAKKSRPTKDFMDILLEQRGDDQEVVKAILMEILAAGTDTSACTVEWALLELLNNPEIMKKAQEELDVVVGGGRTVLESDFPKLTYLEAIIKETFRIHPPTPLLVPRMSTQACALGQSFHIPKGATTIVNYYSIGRDPEVWENPAKFWPERFLGLAIDVKGHDFELIPFGAGRRICPGMSLGLKTVYLTLGNLLHGFDWHRLPGKNYGVDETFGAVTWPKSSLQVRVTRRLENTNT